MATAAVYKSLHCTRRWGGQGCYSNLHTHTLLLVSGGDRAEDNGAIPRVSWPPFVPVAYLRRIGGNVGSSVEGMREERVFKGFAETRALTEIDGH